MAEAQAAILDHEEKATCQRCHKIEGTLGEVSDTAERQATRDLLPPDFTSQRNKLLFGLNH